MAVEVKEEERKGGDKGGEVYVYGTINFHLAEEERLGRWGAGCISIYLWVSFGPDIFCGE